ncbi:MAG: sigma-70 family RNA polymerase sigma factor [Bacteroidia bacterium]|nr:sigma-70 family RNA polymerase sigma factor [Bacteroidia bacterium]
MNTIKSNLNPELWVDLYADSLFRYACKRINQRETAKELVQETFLAALKALPNFKGAISEKNWLYTILKNKIIDYYRKKTPVYIEDFTTNEKEYSYSFDDSGHWKQEKSKPGWIANENDVLLNKEFMQVLAKCRQKLNEIQDAVFSMKYIDETNSEEICKELNITTSNYWVIMHRAKLLLRACIQKNWLNEKL